MTLGNFHKSDETHSAAALKTEKIISKTHTHVFSYDVEGNNLSKWRVD